MYVIPTYVVKKGLVSGRQRFASVSHPLNDLVLAESDVSAARQTDARDALVLAASLAGAFMYPANIDLQHIG